MTFHAAHYTPWHMYYICLHLLLSCFLFGLWRIAIIPINRILITVIAPVTNGVLWPSQWESDSRELEYLCGAEQPQKQTITPLDRNSTSNVRNDRTFDIWHFGRQMRERAMSALHAQERRRPFIWTSSPGENATWHLSIIKSGVLTNCLQVK